MCHSLNNYVTWVGDCVDRVTESNYYLFIGNTSTNIGFGLINT